MIEKKPTPTMFILHAYQPVTQEKKVFQRIIENCYVPFFKRLRENKNAKIVLNITGCLIERLVKENAKVIELIQANIQSGQIDLMGSAFYHPILPFLSPKEIQYQIQKQTNIIRKEFNYDPQIFFPPELAISPDIIESIIDEGFKAIIGPTNSHQFTFRGLYETLEKNIIILNREKNISNGISFNGYKGQIESVIYDIRSSFEQHQYPVIIAMDLETYGEHIPNYYQFFYRLASKLLTITHKELLEQFSVKKTINNLIPSSWSTSVDDLKQGIYFPLWDHPDNSIHQLQHLHTSLLDYCIEHVSVDESTYDKYQASKYSCQYWWASGHWWSKKLIRLGLDYQKDVLSLISPHLPSNTKQAVIKQSENIIRRIDRILDIKK